MAHICNLIVDSCCDLPFELVDKEGITLLPFPYFFGEEEHSDDLFQSTTAREFYDRMRDGAMPTTAQLPLSRLVDAFEKVAESHVPTVYLSFTSGLSKSYEVAVMARDQVKAEHPDMELHVVDTLMPSSGEGLFVHEAIRQWESGLSAQELVDWALENRWFANVYFIVDELEALARGGRMPSSIAYVGSKLKLKPILYIDHEGTIQTQGAVLGRRKALAKLLQVFDERRNGELPYKQVICQGGDCAGDVDAMLAEISKRFPEAEAIGGNVGPTIGSHVGPGVVTLAFWGRDRRLDK